MRVPDKERSLEDVLNEYGASKSGPSHASLQEWIRRFPEYRKELTEFTVNWIMMEHVPPPSEAQKVDHDTLVLRAMSIVQDRLHRATIEKRAIKPNETDLLSECKRLGLEVSTIASKCDLSIAIMAKLGRRLIKFASIPREAIRRIAAATGQTEKRVTESLKGPIVIADELRFSAKTRPKYPEEQEDFFEAIRMDGTLDESKRAFWLSLERR